MKIIANKCFKFLTKSGVLQSISAANIPDFVPENEIFLIEKKDRGYEFLKLVGQNELSTCSKPMEKFNVGENTTKRDAKFARGLSLIGKFNPKLKNKILAGETKIKKSDIMLFSDIDKKDLKEVKNEVDLYNKASRIRNKILTNIEQRLKEDKEKKVKQAQPELKGRNAAFIDEPDRINRIKVEIMSTINGAIENGDIKKLNRLRGLMEKLQDLLFIDHGN